MPIAINGTAGSITGVTTTISQGGTTSSSAVDITLTNASTQVQYVSMTAVDKFVILPSATTLGKGQAIFTIVNNGQYPFHVKNNAGNIICYNLMSGETQIITLVDNATAAGVWANQDGTLSLYGGLPQVSSIAATSSSYSTPVVAMLSATQALIFYSPSSAIIRVVLATISDTSVSYGTPVDVVASGGSGNYLMKAFAFNATTGILCYYNEAPNPNWILRAVTVSGSTVTVGAITNLTSNNGGFTADSGYMAMLDSTTGFVGYVQSTPQTNIRAFTVSGTTITLGSVTTLTTIGTSFSNCSQISSGKVIFGYTNGGPALFRVATNSGTTLTLGTALTTSGILEEMVYSANYSKISTDAVSGFSSSDSNGYNVTAVPVSGTTIGAPKSTIAIGPVPRTTDTQVRTKYIADGLQIFYAHYRGSSAWVSLLKGNSSSGATGVSKFSLGVFTQTVFGGTNMFDVINGNKGIVVGIRNNFVTAQVIGVL
jgi:hypothetical protein